MGNYNPTNFLGNIEIWGENFLKKLQFGAQAPLPQKGRGVGRTISDTFL